MKIFYKLIVTLFIAGFSIIGNFAFGQLQNNTWVIPYEVTTVTPFPLNSDLWQFYPGPLPIQTLISGDLYPPYHYGCIDKDLFPQIPYGYNSMQDYNGNLLFYVVDGTIFDGNGNYLCDIADNAGITLQGSFPEIGIVPVPGTCLKYYIVLLYRYFAYYGMLDMSEYASSGKAYFNDPIYAYALPDITGICTDRPAIKLTDLNNFSLHGYQAMLAITQPKSDGNRFLFIADKCVIYKFDITNPAISLSGSIGSYVASCLSRELISEMEIWQDPAGGYLLAVPSGVPINNVDLVQLDASGNYVTDNALALDGTIGDREIKGVEFSPNGQFIYITRQNYPFIECYSTSTPWQPVAGWSATNNTLLTWDAGYYSNSFIEMSQDGYLYFGTDISGTGQLESWSLPDNPTSTIGTWTITTFPLGTPFPLAYYENPDTHDNFREYILGDQIDQDNYYTHGGGPGTQDFTIADNPACLDAGSTIATITTYNPLNTYIWSSSPAGLLITGSADTYTISYTAAGTYTVCLTTYNDGCGPDIKCEIFQVNPLEVSYKEHPHCLCVDFISYVSCGPITTYSWSFPGGTPSTSSSDHDTVCYPVAGYYTVFLTVTDGAGNTASTPPIEIVVGGEADCCPAAFDPNYTHVSSLDPPIVGYTVWAAPYAKYYVEDMITVDGFLGSTVLDITNIDVVFAPCAGIKFINGARLEANNSVFRPCNANDVWSGFEFIDSPDNIIESCVFKNAWIALKFRSTTETNETDGEITNNHFYNCHLGMYKSGKSNIFNYPITGNKFEVNSSIPDYSDCYGPFSNSYGIKCAGTIFTYPISQNQFINGGNTNTFQSYGIFFENGAAQISENIFTDMNQSVFIDKPTQAFSIENNEMDVLNSQEDLFSLIGQVVIDNATVPILIYNNKITNSTPDPQNSTNNSGIEAINSSLVDVNSNEIKGFFTGIGFYGVMNSQIVQNTITDAHNYGIYVGPLSTTAQTSQKINIACNDIDLRNDNTESINIGIGLYYLATNCQIYSNCIFNTQTGIYLQYYPPATWPVTYNIPSINNNYIYNYTECGIYDNCYTGFIGGPGFPGTNTLYSNRIGPPNDITCFPTSPLQNNLTATDNWLSVVSGNVTVNGTAGLGNGLGTDIYSNASCANQTYQQPSQPTLTFLTCDNMKLMIIPIIPGGTDYNLAPDYQNVISLIEGDRYEFILGIQNALLSNTDKTLATDFNNSLNQSNWITSQEKLWVNYYYFLDLNNYDQAFQSLSAIHPADIDEEDLWNIEMINMKWLLGQYPNNILADADLTILSDVAINKRIYSNYAIALLSNFDDSYSLINPLELLPTYDLSIKGFRLDNNHIGVYPNPAKDILTLIIPTRQKVKVKLEDITGRNLKTLEFFGEAIEQTINISELSNGLYFVVVTDENNHYIQRTKFVKQK